MWRAEMVFEARRRRGRGSRFGTAAGVAGALAALAAFAAGGSESESAGAERAWLDLRPGAAVEVSYTAADPRLLGLLEAAEPRALAADDFDEDGIHDLVVGLAAGEEGLVALHRGNPDAIYPHSEASARRRAEGDFSDAPFASPAAVFALPSPADFVATGDFDNDGHRDAIAGAWGATALHVLPGDGRGGLGAPRRLELPGRLTAAAAGEVNRRDGIADLAVAVDAAEGPRLLVFESPLGVLAAEPETFPLPAAASALALARIDADAVLDLAVAAGNELVIVHGRDRRLSLDAARQARVPAARVTRFDLPFAIADLAAGDFLYDLEHRPELALLGDGGGAWIVPRAIVEAEEAGAPRVLAAGDLVAVETGGVPPAGARLFAASASVRAADDLVVVDPLGGALRVLSSAPDPLAVSRGQASPETAAANPAVALEPAAAPVTALPLRLSPDPLTDLVLLTEHGPDPVVVFADWPVQGGVTATVNLATTQLDANPGDGVCDVDLVLPGPQCTLMAAIQEVELASGASSIGFAAGGTYRHFGTTPATGFPVPVTLSGAAAGGPVEIWGGHLSFRGGSSLVSELVIAGGDIGFLDLGGNVVEASLLGTDITGTSASPFGTTRLSTTNATTTIGGPSPAARNVVSGRGISSFSTGDVIQGNYIGTDVTGLAAIGNGFNNAALDVGGAMSVVGGTAAGAGNVVAGNQREGVILRTSGLLFQGNFVGVGADGTTPLGNGRVGLNVGGVVTPDMVTIGGTAPAARNLISNNGFASNADRGVILNTTNALVQGNHIGTDATGTAAMGNNLGGIQLAGTGNAIGGAVAGAGNVIADSRSALPNWGYGLYLVGLQVQAPSSGNLVQGNRIGVGADGTTPMGNANHGVFLDGEGALDNTVGGTDPGAGNVIAHSGGAGVALGGGGNPAGSGNEILGNSIHDNAGLGIDLAADGPTPNDPGDGDGGPNDRQNYPVIDTVGGLAGDAIAGTLGSRPNRAYRLEFFANAACDPSGFGEGETFLGATDVTTDGAGEATFSVAFAGTRNPAATATDLATGDTSELSPCVPFGPRVSVINSVGDAPDLDTGDGECDTGDVILREGSPEPECTLRAFLQQANAAAGTDEGRFDVPADQYPPTGWPLVRAQSPLPAVTDAIVLDGATQPGAGQVEVSSGAGGTAAPAGACPGMGQFGFVLVAAGSRLADLAINCHDTAVLVLGGGTLLERLVIGTDFAGAPGLAGTFGVVFDDGDGSRVDDSVIVGHAFQGVFITGSSTDNQVTNCFIGTDRAGAPGFGNGVGIVMNGSSNLIDGNTVGGNTSHGIVIQGVSVTSNRVIRNFIGTDAQSSSGLRNGGDGVRIEDAGAAGPDNEIGEGPGTGNVISNNGGAGVHTVETDGQRVRSNRIGTTVDGAGALGNLGPGVWIEAGRDVVIGEVDPNDPDECEIGGGNVISANGGDGILLSGVEATDNLVCDNLIGTDAAGTAPLGNGGAGVRFDDAGLGSSNTVGFSVIAHNAAAGIAVGDAFDVNWFYGNRIFANGGLGIDLEDDGVTPNDTGDGDVGANHRQNFPVIGSAYVTPGGVVTVRGTLESILDEPFSIEIFSNQDCDPAGHGEGEFGSAVTDVQTDLLGRASFTVHFAAPVFDNLTATASRLVDPGIELAETSEFSACVDPQAPAQALVIDEVDAAAASPALEFIELSQRPASQVSLAGRVLVLFDGATGASYAAFDLDGFFTGPDGYFVAGASGVTAADLTIPDGILQDGADAVALYLGNASDFPNGTPVTTAGLIDALVYGSGQGADPGLLALLEPDQPQVDESAGGDLPGHANLRCPDSAGGERFTDTYVQGAPTPGAENHCSVCTLSPLRAGGPVGGDHAVTARVLIDNLTPAAGTTVEFEVVTGPNAGTQGSAGTDADGRASFTYTGAGGTGVDLLLASGIAAGRPFACTATATWVDPLVIFTDGFESGDTTSWSATTP